MVDYNIKEIVDAYLSKCSPEGQKYISQFPLQVIQKVKYEVLERASTFFKEISQRNINPELNCSEHGCLEDHF